jgi:P27 family predicted phage terminase small subunit
MGKRGPKPKPKALNVLEGNPSRRPMVPDELDVSPDLPPVMPGIVELDRVAAAEWQRLIATMPAPLYTAADVAVLTQYCLSWSLLHQAQAEIDENGIVIRETNEISGETKTKSNPAVAIWKAANENLHKSADRLGLNPSIRSKMALPQARSAPESKAASRFLGLIAQK